MSNNFLTNEQKLDYVFETIKKQESRNAWARWFNMAKWFLILFVAYFVATNPTFILDKVTAIMRPFIIENVKSMTDRSKSNFLDDIKKVLQENQVQ
jgi:hypothetical protein